MQIERDTLVPGPPGRAFALVDDLSAYPAWMDLVHDVREVVGEEAVGEEVSAPDGGARLVWEVELRAQVGPFARSKRLRMVRTVHEPFRRVVFERAETDGRRHSTWILAATLDPATPLDSHADSHVDAHADSFGASGTKLTMILTYGGNLWTGAVLQRVLDDHVQRGAAALCALLSGARDVDGTA